MTSPARLAANRANAQRSTGPRTPAGKARSAQNARKHGLAARNGGDPAEIARLAAVLSEGRDDPAARQAAAACARAMHDWRRATAAATRLCDPDLIAGLDNPPRRAIWRDARQYRAAFRRACRAGDAETDAAAAARRDVRTAGARMAEGRDRQDLALAAAEAVRVLQRLARYETRAYSAYKTACARLQSALRRRDDPPDPGGGGGRTSIALQRSAPSRPDVPVATPARAGAADETALRDKTRTPGQTAAADSCDRDGPGRPLAPAGRPLAPAKTPGRGGQTGQTKPSDKPGPPAAGAVGRAAARRDLAQRTQRASTNAARAPRPGDPLVAQRRSRTRAHRSPSKFTVRQATWSLGGRVRP